VTDYANAYLSRSSLSRLMINIDLDLLRVFDVLFDECNVTRAAARLFLSQSAVSHALARLRDVLGDPFFVRIPSGLQPTSRAHQLAPRLRVALAEIRNVVAIPLFDPAKIRQRFVISAGPYFCMLIVPNLIALARKSAPSITLQIVNTSADLAQALDQQQVDIALGAFDRVPPASDPKFSFTMRKRGRSAPIILSPNNRSTMPPSSPGRVLPSASPRRPTCRVNHPHAKISCLASSWKLTMKRIHFDWASEPRPR
jgi:DNA-binding transcriptional LysR family regulator